LYATSMTVEPFVCLFVKLFDDGEVRREVLWNKDGNVGIWGNQARTKFLVLACDFSTLQNYTNSNKDDVEE
jgi:hypothetical protein